MDGGPHHRSACTRSGTPRCTRVGARDTAMERDAIATTHPVVQHVETVEQANQAFDAITYSEGRRRSSRMLEGYVGEEAWREGVRSYMKKHAYGNTVSDDLWRADRGRRGQAHHSTSRTTSRCSRACR